MLKSIWLSTLIGILLTSSGNPYPWLDGYDSKQNIEQQIDTPKGYIRTSLDPTSFAHWLRNLPMKPANTKVKLYDGTERWDQASQVGVIDLDFIGKNLQQCIDVIIRLRAEYLRSVGNADDIRFSYTCCKEKIAWTKWKNGWRTKIVKRNNRDTFEWIKRAEYDDSRKNFLDYLYHIMMYAGTSSLSENMKKIDPCDVQIGDAYIQGGAPGYGHGVIIVDMAISPRTGEKIMLLGQSYNPAENFNILKSNSDLSPWFRVWFDEKLETPHWSFTNQHARRF